MTGTGTDWRRRWALVIAGGIVMARRLAFATYKGCSCCRSRATTVGRARYSALRSRCKTLLWGVAQPLTGISAPMTYRLRERIPRRHPRYFTPCAFATLITLALFLATAIRYAPQAAQANLAHCLATEAKALPARENAGVHEPASRAIEQCVAN